MGNFPGSVIGETSRIVRRYMRDGGKGDKPRPIKDRKQYEDNWDAIFKAPERQTPIQTKYGALYYGTPCHGESIYLSDDGTYGYIHGKELE